MKKINICFVCLGNICRSPMAEFILKDKLKKENISNIIVESRGISNEEEGNFIYPKALKTLEKHHIFVDKHKAKQITTEDVNKFDYIICMEEFQVEALKRLFKTNIIKKLQPYDIEDPWYTNNFEKVYDEINDGCNKIIKKIKSIS